MKFPAVIVGFAILASPLFAQSSQRPPFTIVETGAQHWRIDDAVAAIGDSHATLLIAPGVYKQCAVQDAGYIIFRAEAPGKAIFDTTTCEGKAALVLGGRGAEIHGLVFQNMRVPDANGAGIRLEKGDLTITHSLFQNSEQGILTANDPGSSIVIDHSTFSGLGRCDRGLSCAHSIYIGDYGSLKVTNSRFEQGTGGHYVKSRTARVAILDSSFDDSKGRTTNYMIDLPNGAMGEIRNNVFVQGQDKENYSAFIAVAAEERRNGSSGLSIRNNNATLAPDVDRSTHFVADWSHEPLKINGNILGKGVALFETR